MDDKELRRYLISIGKGVNSTKEAFDVLQKNQNELTKTVNKVATQFQGFRIATESRLKALESENMERNNQESLRKKTIVVVAAVVFVLGVVAEVLGFEIKEILERIESKTEHRYESND